VTFWTEQAYRRLRQIKAEVDPQDLLRANHGRATQALGRDEHPCEHFRILRRAAFRETAVANTNWASDASEDR
jgi:hypothetical protein